MSKTCDGYNEPARIEFLDNLVMSESMFIGGSNVLSDESRPAE